jgi:hypothetical protein
MSEDKSDKKLPVRYHKPETTPTAVDRVHPPVSNQTFVGRSVSGFVAWLNRHTIERNTEEIEARIKNQHAEAKLAEATLERDRAVEHYLQHRNNIIADDHEQYLEQRESNRIERADAREEREHQRQLARERRQQELNQARFASATTRFGLDVFNQTLPYRQEELEQKAKTGTLDAELDMLMRVKDVAQSRKSEATPPPPPQTDALEKMLAELDHEIEVAHGTNQSDDVKSALTSTKRATAFTMKASGSFTAHL